MNERKKILLLDDEPIVCERLQPALEKNGFDVETFTDSAKAVERFREQTFDAVITDLKMRKPDGMEVLRIVKELAPETKVVLITGFPSAEAVRESMKQGAEDFLSKPFKISDLVGLLLRLTGCTNEEIQN